ADLEMVLQALANAGQVVRDRDAVPPQQRGGADARELQQLRRVDRAAGEDHLVARARYALAAALEIGDARRPSAVEHDARRERARRHREIGAPARRAEVFARRRGAQTVADGELEITDAVLALAVAIVVARQPGGDRRVDEGLAERV